MKKAIKGQYGYTNYQKKIEIIKTIAIFMLALSIYMLGLYTTGTKSNLLTIVSILGMLPASKSAVHMIMFLRFKTGSKEVYQDTVNFIDQFPIIYDLIITTEKNAFQISSAICYANTLFCYNENSKNDLHILENHLKDMLSKNGAKNIQVKVFNDFMQYKNSFISMKENLTMNEDNMHQVIFNLLKSLSL